MQLHYDRSKYLLNLIGDSPVLLINPYINKPDLDANLAGIALALKNANRKPELIKFNALPSSSLVSSPLENIQVRIQDLNQEKMIRREFRKLGIRFVKRNIFETQKSFTFAEEEVAENLIDYLQIEPSSYSRKGIFSEISEFVDPTSILNSRWKKRIKLLEVDIKFFELELQEVLANRTSDTVVIIPNGKWALTASAIEFTRSKGFTTFISESGSKINRIQLFQHSVHSLKEWEENIRFDWENAIPIEEKRRIALTFINKNREPKQNPYTYLMQPGLEIPRKFDNEKRIVFFTTSDAESSPFEDEKESNVFLNQYEAAETLFGLAQFKGWDKVIRCHPHLHRAKLIRNPEHEKWERLAIKLKCEIVPSLSRIDSYALVKSANLVAGFSSTILLESIFMGIPTAICGPTFLSSLLTGNCFENKQSLEDLDLSFLEKLANERDRVLPFFYHQSIRGFDNRFLRGLQPINRKSWEVRLSIILRFLSNRQTWKNT